MGRTKKCRNIAQEPKCYLFEPADSIQDDLAAVALSLDEYEAIRLSDLEGMDMQAWALSMGISAPTFNRILKAAHYKMAQALVEVRAIKICKCEQK